MPLKTQKIETNNKTEVVLATDDFSSIMFTNTHATDAVTIDLWVVDQTGQSVTSTGVYVSTSSFSPSLGTSTQVNVDNGSGGTSAATDDLLLNERIYDSSNNFYGICTTVNTNILLTFSDGIYRRLTENTILHVGTRFYVFNNVTIPNGASLQLESSDLSFDNNNYNMYIDSNTADGYIDIITSI